MASNVRSNITFLSNVIFYDLLLTALSLTFCVVNEIAMYFLSCNCLRCYNNSNTSGLLLSHSLLTKFIQYNAHVQVHCIQHIYISIQSPELLIITM